MKPSSDFFVSCVSLCFFVVNFAVKLLQGFNFTGFMRLHITDSACSCSGSSNGSHIRNLCLDCCFTKITVIIYAVFSDWRVDDQINLSVCDQIQNIWATFRKFVDFFSRDTCKSNLIVGSAGCYDMEAVYVEFLSYFDNFFRLQSIAV